MKVKYSKPTAMFVDSENPITDDELCSLSPRRYSKRQKRVPLLPFTVITDHGVVADKGMVCVNAQGKVVIESTVEEVGFDVDNQ